MNDQRSGYVRAVLTGQRGIWAMGLAAVIGAVLVVLVTRDMIDHVPLYDELLHVLAAQGLLESGAPVIGTGEYRRGELFTRAVAFSFERMGVDLVAARLPALLATAALVALIGAWVTRRAGLLAGIAAACVLALAPLTIQLAVIARFYTLHALAATVLLICAYEASIPARKLSARIGLGVLALAALVVAWRLQPSTIIAAGACVAGLLAVAVLDSWPRLRAMAAAHRRAVVGTAVGIALAAAAGLWVASSVLLAWLGPPPLWAVDRAGRVAYYLQVMTEHLPLLWPLLPLAAAAALMVNRRLAVFCIAAAVSALVVHSLAPFKAPRYIYYLLPLLAVLWGCGLAFAVEWLARGLRRLAPGIRPATALFAAIAAVGLMLINSEEGIRSARLVLGKATQAQILPYTTEGDWIAAGAVLAPAVADADRLIVSSGVKALYALGRFDYEINPSVVAETDSGSEFGWDSRTGRQAIGSAESLARLLDEPGRTLIVADEEKVGSRTGITPQALELLTSRCHRVAVPQETRVVAWECGPLPHTRHTMLSEQ